MATSNSRGLFVANSLAGTGALKHQQPSPLVTRPQSKLVNHKYFWDGWNIALIWHFSHRNSAERPLQSDKRSNLPSCSKKNINLSCSMQIMGHIPFQQIQHIFSHQGNYIWLRHCTRQCRLIKLFQKNLFFWKRNTKYFGLGFFKNFIFLWLCLQLEKESWQIYNESLSLIITKIKASCSNFSHIILLDNFTHKSSYSCLIQAHTMEKHVHSWLQWVCSGVLTRALSDYRVFN